MSFFKKISASFVGILLFVAQLIANKFSLYWVFPKLDIYMHFLGGVFFGFIFTGWFNLEKFSKPKKFWIPVIFILVIGIGWELFEFVLDILFNAGLQPSLADTFADICFDSAGFLLVIIVDLLNKERKYECKA